MTVYHKLKNIFDNHLLTSLIFFLQKDSQVRNISIECSLYINDQFLPNFLFGIIITIAVSKMSRNNVFKLSGNMALGGNDYANSDFDNIKSSLKLLKGKNAQKGSQPQQPNYYPPSYGSNPPSYSSNAPSRQQPASKNMAYEQQNYNYPTNSRPQQSGSYKDVYYQAEQNYPKSDYKPQRRNDNYDQYNQPQRNYQEKAYKQKAYQAQPQQRQPQPQQDYRQQAKQPNAFEERSIKEINRENRVQIEEYAPDQLVPCRQCGRKFNPDSIQKHQSICKKVFVEKRKEFNAQNQRIVAKEQKKLMKYGEVVEKKLEEKKAKEKIPKWKAQSLQLRVGLKNARTDNYQPTREQRQVLESANSFTKCQFCGRSFNETAAKKHIPFCQSQQRKNQIKRR